METTKFMWHYDQIKGWYKVYIKTWQQSNLSKDNE